MGQGAEAKGSNKRPQTARWSEPEIRGLSGREWQIALEADRQVRNVAKRGLGPRAVEVDYRLGVKAGAKPKNKPQSQLAN